MFDSTKYDKLLLNLGVIKKQVSGGDIIHSAVDLRKNLDNFTSLLCNDFDIGLDTNQYSSVTLDKKIKALQNELLTKNEANTFFSIKRIGNPAAHELETTSGSIEEISNLLQKYEKIIIDYKTNYEEKHRNFLAKKENNNSCFANALSDIEKCINMIYYDQLSTDEDYIEFKKQLYTALEEFDYEQCQKYRIKLKDTSIFEMNSALKKYGYLDDENDNLSWDTSGKNAVINFWKDSFYDVEKDYVVYNRQWSEYELRESIRKSCESAFSGDKTFHDNYLTYAVALYGQIYDQACKFCDINHIECFKKGCADAEKKCLEAKEDYDKWCEEDEKLWAQEEQKYKAKEQNEKITNFLGWAGIVFLVLIITRNATCAVIAIILIFLLKIGMFKSQ